MVADKVRDYYDKQAKERQKERRGGQPGAEVVMLPPLEKSKSRDAAGNLTESQRSYLRGKRYQAEKKREGGSGSNQYTKELDQNDTVPTADRLATELHVSAPTIKRANLVHHWWEKILPPVDESDGLSIIALGWSIHWPPRA